MNKVVSHMIHSSDSTPLIQREPLAFTRVILFALLWRLGYSIVVVCIKNLSDVALPISISKEDSKNSSIDIYKSKFRLCQVDFAGFNSACNQESRLQETEPITYCGFNITKSSFINNKKFINNPINI